MNDTSHISYTVKVSEEGLRTRKTVDVRNISEKVSVKSSALQDFGVICPFWATHGLC